MVKSEFGRPLEPFWTDPDGDLVVSSAEVLDGRGLSVRLADGYTELWEPDCVSFIYRMRSLLLPFGYVAFLTEWDDSYPYLAVLKTLDENEIIRVVETQGFGSDCKHRQPDQLISLLDEWRLCDFSVIGAGHDNIRMEFGTLPQDVVAFAEGVNYLCFGMDQVYGIGNISEDVTENRLAAEQLADIIRRTKRLCLCWD